MYANETNSNALKFFYLDIVFKKYDGPKLHNINRCSNLKIEQDYLMVRNLANFRHLGYNLWTKHHI